MSSGSALSARQRAVVAALVSGLSKQEAAATVGVRPETVSRYLRDPCVRAALRDAQGDMLGDVVRSMTAGSKDMLAVLPFVGGDADLAPPEPEPDVCPVCGKRRQTIIVEWEEDG